jgi:hypothetical protein
MFSTIILFVTAVLGFLCTALIFGKNKYQEHSLINKYLIIITATNAIRFLVYGIAEAYPEADFSKMATLLDVSIIMLMPCFYLYFTNIIFESKFELSNLMHFTVPSLLGSLFITASFVNSGQSNLLKKLFFLLFECYTQDTVELEAKILSGRLIESFEIIFNEMIAAEDVTLDFDWSITRLKEMMSEDAFIDKKIIDQLPLHPLKRDTISRKLKLKSFVNF